MKSSITSALFFLPAIVFAQTGSVKIVFDVTSKDTLTHQTVVRHVEGIAKAYPHALIEVVIYGGAWPMAVSGKSTRESAITQLSANQNVSFKICSITMGRFNVRPADLVSGVETVEDGLLEIVAKQQEGWGYIKESHN